MQEHTILFMFLYVIVQVKDPRVDVNANKEFLTLMEEYFARPKEDKEAEARPDLHYQVRSSHFVQPH